MTGSPLAVAFLLGCTWLQTRGSKEAGDFNNWVTTAKLLILAFIVVISLAHFEIENFDPFLDERKGIAGVIEGATILFFGYLGFDFITTMSEEAKNPQRDVPAAIQLSVVLSMAVYALVAFAVNGVGNLARAGSGDGETALAETFAHRGLPWMAIVIFACAVLGITAAALTNLMSQSRILYSYAKDGLFYQVFKDIDPQKKVPIKGAWLSVIPVCIGAFFMNLAQLAKLCSLCNLMTYAFIDAAVVALRLRAASSPRDLLDDSGMGSISEGGADPSTPLPKQAPKERLKQALRTWTPWTFLVISFLSAVSIGQGWSPDAQIVIGVLTLINFLVLQVLVSEAEAKAQEMKARDAPSPAGGQQEAPMFRCPLVPLLPCLGIYSNFILCTAGVGAAEWLLFLSFEGVGILFYLCYGYKHSRMPKRLQKHRVQKYRESLSAAGQLRAGNLSVDLAGRLDATR